MGRCVEGLIGSGRKVRKDYGNRECINYDNHLHKIIYTLIFDFFRSPVCSLLSPPYDHRLLLLFAITIIMVILIVIIV